MTWKSLLKRLPVRRRLRNGTDIVRIFHFSILRMPGLDAVGVINRIRETDPAARCLVLTTFDTDEDIYRAVKSGAKGYLLKDAPRDILLESIRKVHGGETCLAPKLTQKLGVSGVFTGTSATRRLPSGARPDQTNIQGFGTASARSNVPRSSVPLAKNWRAAPPATPFGGTGALPAFVIIAGDATRPLGLRKRAS